MTMISHVPSESWSSLFGEPLMIGPIESFLTADHARLDALLARAERADAVPVAPHYDGPLLNRHVRPK